MSRVLYVEKGFCIVMSSFSYLMTSLPNKEMCYCPHSSQFKSNSSGAQWVKQIHSASLTLGCKANDSSSRLVLKKISIFFLRLLEEVAVAKLIGASQRDPVRNASI